MDYLQLVQDNANRASAAGAEAEAAQLPATGTGLDGNDGWAVSTLALIFGVAAVAGIGAAWATRRWVRS